MFKEIYDKEFKYIIKDILSNDEFLKTKQKVHHGITRYDHLMRVSYYSFLVSKFLRLNYKETTRAALLHDFFLDETKDDNKLQALQKHPIYALENAKKYYKLTPLQEDIIKTHMFPVNLSIPKYAESWVVNLVDKFIGTCEFSVKFGNKFDYAANLAIVLFMNIMK